MKQIGLSRRKVAIVDEEDFATLSKWKWYCTAQGYAAHDVNKPPPNGHYKDHQVLMHRLLTNAPKGIEVDHINGDKLDNRRVNLRLANRSQNMGNVFHVGVTYFKWGKRLKRWKAQIMVNYQNKFLGYFLTEDEAIKAYAEAKQKYFGEFAKVA